MVPEHSPISVVNTKTLPLESYSKLGGHWVVWAYAVLYSGALKIVNQLGIEYDSAAYDVELGWMCRDGRIDCVSVHPPLFGTHKAAGNEDKDSDIVSTHDETRQRPFTYNIAKSVRLNMHHLVHGELDQVSDQFDDMPELYGPILGKFQI